jgi:hypothetical protein
MSNGNEPVYWKITPNSAFVFSYTVYMPSKTYYVPDAIYQATDIGDGSTFASHCASADQVMGVPG